MTGNQFKKLRKELGLTQKDVAERLGAAYQGTVQRWEKKGEEEIHINSKYLVPLAEIMECTVHDFAPAAELHRASMSGITVTADNGSVAQSAGRDAKTNIGSSVNKLYPLEEQVISLNREVGSDNVLINLINQLIDIKKRRSELEGRS